MLSRILLFALFVFGMHAVAAEITGPDCGGLRQRKCTIADAETYAMDGVGIPFKGCEYDLQPDTLNLFRTAHCINFKRFTRSKLTNWVAWANAQQRYIIGRDEPINWITHVGAHNAYSNAAQGYTSPATQNQKRSITDQLNLGMRMLELDPHYILGQVRLCHGATDGECLVPGNLSGRLFAYGIQEIAQWLDANPDEVLILLLDNHVASEHMAVVTKILQDYLGNRIFQKTSSSLARWPTMGELRSSGKRVVVFSTQDDPSPLIFYSKTYLTKSNRNGSADATPGVCTDGDGNSGPQRAINKWFDIAEGRTGSDLLNPTGLLYEREVAAFVKCSASIIGFDFVDALDVAFPTFDRPGPDNRLAASIWSFADGDFGTSGPAALNLSGHWASRPANLPYPFACALRDRTGVNFQERQWKITSALLPWSAAAGEQACVQEFGPQYTFAYPANGYQNAQVLNALNNYGSGQAVWLRFQAEPQPVLAVDEISLDFYAIRGGPAPAAQQITIRGLPNTTFGVLLSAPKDTPPWLQATPRTGIFGPDGTAVITFSSALPAASDVYLARAEVADGVNPLLSRLTAAIPARLTLLEPTVTTITADHNPVAVGQSTTLTLKVASNPSQPPTIPPIGKLDLYLTHTGPATQKPVSILEQSWPQFSFANPVVAQFAIAPDIPGDYVFDAVFTGSSSIDAQGITHLTHDGSSASLTLVVTPRIVVTPPTMNVSWEKGHSGALASRAFTAASTVAGLNYTVLQQGDWLKVSKVTGNQFQADFAMAAVNALSVGSHTAEVRFADSAGDGFTNSLFVMLIVTTPLTVNPSTFDVLLSTGSSTKLFSTASAAVNMPVDFDSPQSWLISGDSSVIVPGDFSIGVRSTGLSPGKYSGTLLVNSSHATQAAKVNVNLVVVGPTRITTNAPGRVAIVDGVSTVLPATFTWAPQTQHTLAVPDNQVDGSTRYVFFKWSESLVQNGTVTSNLSGATYDLQFDKQYRLTAQAVPAEGGDVSVNPISSGGFYLPGAPVTVTTTPKRGFFFAGFSGDLTGTQTSRNIRIDAPKFVTAAFSRVAPVQVNLTSNKAGGRVSIDGVEVALPLSFLWTPGSVKQIAPVDRILVAADTRLVFSSWSSGAPARTLNYTVPTTAASLEARFDTQYLVTVSASPAVGGSVSGGGWYSFNAAASIKATPATDYVFSGFTGTLTQSNSVFLATVNMPLNLVANFTGSSFARLYATTAGPRVDGAIADQRLVPIRIMNLGPGTVTGARISSIDFITVMTGTGPVAVSPGTVFPIDAGTILPNAYKDVVIPFDWPAGATRVSFIVNMTANSGQLVNQTTLTLFR